MKLLLAVLLLVSSVSVSLAQPTDRGFQKHYTSAITITPINTAFDIVPNGMVDLVFSLSGEYSIRHSDQLGFVFAGGYYPYVHRTESIASFSLRMFTSKSVAPTGTFFDWSAIGGVVDDAENAAKQTEPLFGVGIRAGGLRNSRFEWFAFEYGAGASFVLIGGQPQFRAQLFFGLGMLLGRTVTVN